jgi:polyhydroxyalkanoate synthesis repressor PhaR
MLVKKYSNRRLYDTVQSRYITLDELSSAIRAGNDVRVVDAKSGADLTQATLAQIILESRGGTHLLPVPVLMQLVRMGDDALAEFFGRYVAWSLDLYLQAKQGLQGISPLTALTNPAAFAAQNPLARMLYAAAPWMEPARPPPHRTASEESEVAQLRRDLDELKRSVAPRRKRS